VAEVAEPAAGRATELAREQKTVNGLYARLDELRGKAKTRLDHVRKSGPAGSPQNRSERDSFATLWEDRASQLDAVEDRLVFGRLDLKPATKGAASLTDGVAVPDVVPVVNGSTGNDGAAPAANENVRYIGRIGLLDEAHRPLLTDWRAPAAEPFYRATTLEPAGVVRRRHLVTQGRKVTGIEDELLDLSVAEHGELEGSTSLSGEGALLAALASRRTGRMRDIVATIQAEQDKIIRAPLAGALVVQGGPGTGKTAVALHRAAYLLYAHRKTLEKSGILLVGPSRAFLKFIDQVLPSLGETGVVSTTIADMLPGITATGTEPDEIAEIKGRAIWADIIRRAVAARERVPEHNIIFRLNGRNLVIRRRDVKDAIYKARRSDKPHNEARSIFVKDMLNRLCDQYEKVTGKRLDNEDRRLVFEDLRELREVRVALNLAWFPLSPKRLVDDLYTKPHRLDQVAPELTETERAMLSREKFAPWTPADIPLLDEAAELLGVDDTIAKAEERARAQAEAEALQYARDAIAAGVGSRSAIPVNAEILAARFADHGPRLSTAERASSDRSWTYGHIVVDEAQELSAMAWRMLLRRVPTRSMTIVGDVAQTSSGAGVRNWAKALDPVLHESWKLNELTVSYRTPAEVALAATEFAEAAGLPVSKLTAARDVPGSWRVIPSTASSLVPDVAATAVAEVHRFAEADGVGQVAVIAVSELVDLITAALAQALANEFGDDAAARLLNPADPQVVVLTPEAAKGLEFDAVVLVEPSQIAASRLNKSALQAASDLYVAMTRPTQQLAIVHAEPLPKGFPD